MKPLENIDEGDWVRWNSRDWEVTGRDVYKESIAYSELQWELSSKGDQDHYLVLSIEEKNGAVERTWVCTRQIGIGSVQHNSASGEWRPFRETDDLPAPPSTCRFAGQVFTLDGETTGDAEDDDGDTVKKLTWDYYDSSRRRNLAIEVWKEPDADYYEAYDGQVVRPSDFQVLPPRPSSRPAMGLQEVGTNIIVGGFICFFFLPLLGGVLSALDVGAEYLVAWMIPAGLIYLTYLLGTDRLLLCTVIPAACAAGWLVVKFRGLGASYWLYALYGLLAGPALTELEGAVFSGGRSSDKAAVAANATLLFLFIISFAHYTGYAPRPHNPGGLLVACVLPLLPALLVFAIYKFKGAADGTPQA